MIEKVLKPAVPDLDLDETEFAAVRLFARLQDQWERNPMTGRHQRIDPGTATTVAGIIGVELTEDVYACLQRLTNVVIREANARA